jgi:spermidine/putrescine transport system substrate-binding protein
MKKALLYALPVVLLPLVGASAKPAPQEAPPAVAEATPPAAAPAAAPAGPCQLNLYIWSEYIDPQIVTDFEKQENCKVTTDLYEDNESMVAKLQGGGTALYDVVVPGNYIIPVMVKLDLLAELNHANIPNIANLDDKFKSPVYDPDNKHSVAYQWGTVGIYLRKSAAKHKERTWGLMLDPKQQVGTFLLMDSIREMLGSVLKAQGHSLNTTNQDELKQAQAALADAKKRSQGFEGGVGGKNKVLAKAVTAAVVYNGDAVRGMADDPDTEYFVPEEGGVLWVDNLAIPAKAPHLAAAEKFINFILDPQVGARLSNFNQYATPNKASKAFVNPDDLKNEAIYPSDAMMQKLEFVNDLGDANKLYDEVWTQVKSK